MCTMRWCGWVNVPSSARMTKVWVACWLWLLRDGDRVRGVGAEVGSMLL